MEVDTKRDLHQVRTAGVGAGAVLVVVLGVLFLAMLVVWVVAQASVPGAGV